MKHRLHLKNRNRFISRVALVGCLILLMATVITAGASSYAVEEPELIVIRSGDTLWEIASVYCTKGDIRNYIADIRKINHLDSDTIHVGQGLLLPVR